MSDVQHQLDVIGGQIRDINENFQQLSIRMNDYDKRIEYDQNTKTTEDMHTGFQSTTVCKWSKKIPYFLVPIARSR